MKIYIPTKNDAAYTKFESLVQMRVESAGNYPLFVGTPTWDLFSQYLSGIKASDRQHYNCNSCRKFFDRFGNIVQVTESGNLVSPLWELENVPTFFRKSVEKLRDSGIMDNALQGVFLTNEQVWGVPRTGDWSHLSGRYGGRLWTSAVLSPDQKMAELKEDYAILNRGLAEFNKDFVVQALRILEGDLVERSEKTVEIAKWLYKIHTDILTVKNPLYRNNLLWKAVATAPQGWCHIRTTMIGTLLEDIANGLSFEDCARKWKEKMHPLQYQRPTTVKAGTLVQANSIVNKLETEGSLKRRFARLSDLINPIWVNGPPSVDQKMSAGPFSNLSVTTSPTKSLPASSKLNFSELLTDVLPYADSLKVLMPTGGGNPFFGFVTACDPQSPPILQWDEDGKRNPVSWYFYNGGSAAHGWNLVAGAWVKCNAITLKPCYWTLTEQEMIAGKMKHQGTGVFFILQGCVDQNYQVKGSFFPEQLKSEYHSIRAAMEAYSQSHILEGRILGSANGICLKEDGSLTIRVNDQHDYRLTLN